MLLGHVDYPQTYEPLLTHPIWKQALDWIAANKEKPDGEYEIVGRDIYASVQTIKALPREEAVLEAHRQYIDLHHCISGGETIAWAPVGTLTPKTTFDTEKDFGLYEMLSTASNLQLTPGVFAVFFPKDAHMPKIFNGEHKLTKKIVVKIRAHLLSVS
jgi:biofilm protein TabA